MPDQRRHRGPHPGDASLFAADQVPALQAATVDLGWLRARGYALPSSFKLVGDRYGLTARQRIATSRCVCTPQQQAQRWRRRQSPSDLAGRPLWIDGYNVLTSVEAALSGGVLIRGLDGCLRDMASMHGSYHRVTETVPSISLIGRFLDHWRIGPCQWFLDEPVSNSGRLRSMLLSTAEQNHWDWQVKLVADPDPLLATADCCIASADSEILDQGPAWLNLVDQLVTEDISGAWIVDLSIRDEAPLPAARADR